MTRFRPGDRVFGFTGFSVGGHAEYVRLPAEGSLCRKPESETFAEAAAAADGATTALFFLRDKAGVRPGQWVLVNGASGSIGTYAVQLAKHLGAVVTAVCGPSNVELVRSLGADEVVDYTERDFTADLDTYDVVFDTVATPPAWRTTSGRRGRRSSASASSPACPWTNGRPCRSSARCSSPANCASSSTAHIR